MSSDSIPNEQRDRSYEGGYMAAGRSAQNVVFSWLKQHPKILEVIDLSEDPEFQLNFGADILVKMKSGKEYYVEVKHDIHIGSNENIVFEIMRINLTASEENTFTQGWSIKSKAHFLFVYDPIFRNIYIMTFADYRSAFIDAAKAMKVNMPKNGQLIPTDKIKRTVLLIFPLSFCRTKKSFQLIAL